MVVSNRLPELVLLVCCPYSAITISQLAVTSHIAKWCQNEKSVLYYCFPVAHPGLFISKRKYAGTDHRDRTGHNDGPGDLKI